MRLSVCIRFTPLANRDRYFVILHRFYPYDGISRRLLLISDEIIIKTNVASDSTLINILSLLRHHHLILLYMQAAVCLRPCVTFHAVSTDNWCHVSQLLNTPVRVEKAISFDQTFYCENFEIFASITLILVSKLRGNKKEDCNYEVD